MNKLKDRHRLIQFIGYSFIFLDILSSMDIIILDLSTIISIPLSGIFFILADFFEYYGIKLSKKSKSTRRSYI